MWCFLAPICAPLSVFLSTKICVYEQELMGTSDITERILFGGAAQVLTRGWCRPTSQQAECFLSCPGCRCVCCPSPCRAVNRSKHSPAVWQRGCTQHTAPPCNLRADNRIQMLAHYCIYCWDCSNVTVVIVVPQSAIQQFKNPSSLFVHGNYTFFILFILQEMLELEAHNQLLSFNQYILYALARSSKNRGLFNPVWKTLFDF